MSGQAPYPAGGSASGHSVKGVGNFLKDNAFQVGATALNLKMGGGLGKILGAGMAADLANKYKNNHGAYNDKGNSQGAYKQQSHSGKSGGLGDLMNTGKSLLGKAEKAVGKTLGGKGHSSSNSGYANPPPSNSPSSYGAASAPVYPSYPPSYDPAPPYHPGYAQPPPYASNAPSYGNDKTQNALTLIPGCEIQLESRATNMTVQIVQNSYGHLVLDAKGSKGSNVFNAIWTISESADGSYAFSNRGHYITVSQGAISLQQTLGFDMPPSEDCWFVVEANPSGGVTLSPARERAAVLAIDPNSTQLIISHVHSYDSTPKLFNIITA